MRRTATLLVLLAAVAALAPGSSLAQSAGDQQYVDPFQGQGQQGGGQTGGGGGQVGEPDAGTVTDESGGTVDAAPPVPTAPGGDGEVAAGSSAPTLPATGAAPLVTLLLGAVLTAGGAALRRRA